MKKGKLYLVRFSITGEKGHFYKIGIHKTSSDVYNRFKQEIEDGIIYNFKIILSVWVPINLLEIVEEGCFKAITNKFGGYKAKDGEVRFHNFYLKEMINGLTEVRIYNQEEVDYAYQLLLTKGDRYIK